jgi:DNA-binding MarR family transcriptional regulator
VSKEERAHLIGEIGRTILELQAATHDVDDAAAARMGLNNTDMRCVRYLLNQGSMTAGELAGASGLTPGALTTALDRLEQAGYAQRVKDRSDRRRVLVELTAQALRIIDEIWGPIVESGQNEMAGYTPQQLQLILGFLRGYADLQAREAERIRGLTSPPSGRAVGADAASPSPSAVPEGIEADPSLKSYS